MCYSLELKQKAIDQLTKINPSIQQRIIKKLQWFEENFEKTIPLPLTGNLSGFYKIRIGDYRVIYTFEISNKIITIHEIGHRKDIYEGR
ncbi:MAG: type II toxin-antitoxin system RelE/ParE family toxin [Cyanobacteria bacterium]|nr:type II toxin-antitoxin system RelE/ParE family toxin [Cyanobacteria bacterium CG_2015-16_32_12]NCO76870.1 type II toxin-antitoxin system RelE/ParE family toxin [Cyanobacteria bacterium CG_2015-22_32_23]NCQ03323.1 type II toxin-antitoxin system RelE/ParE family toxin [Cyanobacteria bacterium CG_2015-09_32_10]NCQ43118.1 type II toxin-antitoxin system RelE/ParE family toxin [Cyanobacteria bacterium CG_2015-04_32_10]NCS84362.1 type II toxin-antitoxin system RelE/ParE family toxin [Cyanobacteria